MMKREASKKKFMPLEKIRNKRIVVKNKELLNFHQYLKKKKITKKENLKI